MPQFCSLFYAILQSWRPKRGAMAQWPPPKYAPGCTKFSEWVDIRNKLNLTKIVGSKIGSLPKRGPPKFKIFNLLSWKHGVFKVSKFKRKIKFDQSLGIPNRGFFPKTDPPKFKFFNHSC